MKKIMYSLFAVALSATVIYSCEKTEGKLSEGQEVTALSLKMLPVFSGLLVTRFSGRLPEEHPIASIL